MEVITSKANQKIVQIKKLQQKKYRQQEQKILLESSKVVDEAINSGLNIETIIVCDENKEQIEKYNNFNLILASQNVCKFLSTTVTSQNVFAVCSMPKNHKTMGNKLLILDNLQNPDNIGAILRTSMATGFVDVVMINCADEFSDKTIRASMGNVFKANIIKSSYEEIENLIRDYVLFTADMSGDNVFNLKNIDKKIALVIGNEGNGVSDFLKQRANKTICIPMQNNVESLNASVSAGIIMYQLSNLGE